ncbi:hypothetical protein ACFXHA_29395 [Nocardia sp. NPDC059240]|uniref:hypothetical protein n=1 Tax=Nocardia sp. NPDC059240 TaxID=3346786 RepID=UPI0036B38C6C
MGAPGCFVIIDADGMRCYPDRWAGNVVCRTLVTGPRNATETIESAHRRGDDTGAVWITEYGLDGGAVIDHPNRTLTWFGDYDLLHEPSTRFVVTGLLELLWPGWRLKWATRGAADLAAAAGLARVDAAPRDGEQGQVAAPLSPAERLAALDEAVGRLAATVGQTSTIAAFDDRPPQELRWGRDRSMLSDEAWSAVLLAAEELRARWTAEV